MNIWFNDPMCACLSLQSFKQEVILGTGAQAYDARSYFFLFFLFTFMRAFSEMWHIQPTYTISERPSLNTRNVLGLAFQKMKAMCYNGLNL